MASPAIDLVAQVGGEVDRERAEGRGAAIRVQRRVAEVRLDPVVDHARVVARQAEHGRNDERWDRDRPGSHEVRGPCRETLDEPVGHLVDDAADFRDALLDQCRPQRLEVQPAKCGLPGQVRRAEVPSEGGRPATASG